MRVRLIDSNAGYVHMADILHQLWSNFYGLASTATTPNSEAKVELK